MINTLFGLDNFSKPHYNPEFQKSDFVKEIRLTAISCYLAAFVLGFLASYLTNGFRFGSTDFMEWYAIMGCIWAAVWTAMRVNAPFRENRAIYLGLGVFAGGSIFLGLLAVSFFR